mmetsp:Transcript_17369/g.37981  ORF Transcript_17369/g.37981 Transcript_17369/m.37981 type:complete len:185 (+) Transcript_17369:2-556(+)
MKSAQVDVSQEAFQLDSAQREAREARSSDLAAAAFLLRVLFIVVLGLVGSVAAAFYARYWQRSRRSALTTQKQDARCVPVSPSWANPAQQNKDLIKEHRIEASGTPSTGTPGAGTPGTMSRKPSTCTGSESMSMMVMLSSKCYVDEPFPHTGEWQTSVKKISRSSSGMSMVSRQNSGFSNSSRE